MTANGEAAFGARVVQDPDAGKRIRIGDFSWSLDEQGRHVVNIFGDGQRVVLSNDGWRALRNLLNALDSIESEERSR
jgi:hypothetical protein